MTAEDLLEKDYFHLVLDSRDSNISVGEIQGAMREYATLKCKELLEIVAEKAYAQVEYDCAVIDKDSILNAVNLKEFIK
jgi:hypothetical protein